MIEWHALLWATGWSNVRELRQADRTMILPVWAGLAELLASGALLEPDLAQPTTVVKLAAVLVLSLNGVGPDPLDARPRAAPAERALPAPCRPAPASDSWRAPSSRRPRGGPRWSSGC